MLTVAGLSGSKLGPCLPRGLPIVAPGRLNAKYHGGEVIAFPDRRQWLPTGVSDASTEVSFDSSPQA